MLYFIIFRNVIGSEEIIGIIIVVVVIFFIVIGILVWFFIFWKLKIECVCKYFICIFCIIFIFNLLIG